MTAQPLFLYIDPGTGSMLFSLAIGVMTAGVFALRAFALKLKFIFSGGKSAKLDASTIPLVLYSDHKRYWNVFKPICDELERREVPGVFYTSSPDDPALSEDYRCVRTEFIGGGNKAFARLNMLSAKIVLSTTPGLDVYQWKRSKNVGFYVHVPHTADELAGYRMFGLDFYDAVLASGKNQIDFIREMERLRPNIRRKELVAVGSVPLDNLKRRFDAAEKGETAAGRKTVLLAPSWGESGILSRFGEKIISALTKTEFNVIIRPHPQTVVSEQNILRPLQEQFTHEQFPTVEWNFDNDNFDALNSADILITDFSGIILDFACVFNKPIIYASQVFDTLPYDADWLTEERWFFKVLPEIGIELKEADIGTIRGTINAAIESADLQNGREKIRSHCWNHIGHSAENIVDYLVHKLEEMDNNKEAENA